MEHVTEKVTQDRNLWNFLQSPHEDKIFGGAHFRLNRVADRVQAHMHKGTVMDLGLGDGYLLQEFHRRGLTVTGLDIADVNIQKLREKMSSEINLVVGNICQMPFAQDTYDGITASEILEHMSNEELDKAIQEIHRVLKPNGIGIVTVPAEEVLEESMFYCPDCGKQFHRFGHKQTFTRERLEKLFGSYGFSSVRVEKFIEPPLNTMWIRFKTNIKNRLVNLPIQYLRNFRGRYMITLIK